MGYGLRVTRTR